MPILPLDHPEPMAATLGVMLYPGEDQFDQRRARAWAAQFLAEPVHDYREAGGVLPPEVNAQLHADTGMPLSDIELRWRDGLAVGEVAALYFKAAHSQPQLASLENSIRAVSAIAKAHGVSASRSVIHDAFRDYRPVAHLWGAFCMRGRGFWPRLEVGYDAYTDFQFFLMEAEILLQWGRTWIPNRRKAKPLLHGDAWEVPASWEPPELKPGWPRTALPLEIPEELLVHFRKAGRPKKSA